MAAADAASLPALQSVFGTVNVLGPRAPNSRPLNMLWDAHLTFVQLRFDLLRRQPNRDGPPLTLERTFLTFYDFECAAARRCRAQH